MEIITSPAAMRAKAEQLRSAGKTIGLVPTMGFFHEGHLTLMRAARAQADVLVVSLFVNPIQFGPGEDLAQYPRDQARDAALARSQKVDVLFAPAATDMYPEGFQTRLEVLALSEPLCGRQRPGHFTGVATVVAKLFNICRPHIAVFGEKDYQQLALIRRMAADLDWDIAILGHPIVREPDGLAMSSRNTYLSPAERRQATCLSQAIRFARGRVRAGSDDPVALKAEVQNFLTSCGDLQIEYAEIVDQQALTPCRTVDERALLALAVRIGRTRLIDNGKLIETSEKDPCSNSC